MPEKERFEIVVINSGAIMGPSFIGAGFTSGEIISKFMEGEYPGVPKVMFSLVDVREVA